MSEIVDPMYLVAVPLAFALALFALWLVARLETPPKPATTDTTEPACQNATLLYRAGVLVDSNARGLALLSGASPEKYDWACVANVLGERFPGFPATQGTARPRVIETYASVDPNEFSVAIVEQWDDMARVQIQTTANNRSTSEPGMANLAMSKAPYPIWQTASNDTITWANSAYLSLAHKMQGISDISTIPKLFETTHSAQNTTRKAVTNANRTQSYWFDVTSVQSGETFIHYASDANAIVNAEIAQRNFVQTLTKTFAQLSIGLAIFDRNRQLSLFNPALIDLTSLPADFLSSRPNLLTVFDRLRENRMIPEPKNYSSWREQIAELVVAASDDRYCETWSLPSGVTYRVHGRPHPDGAIALLFEDISAEVSLTRRFRAELELNQAVLDGLNAAIAVFSPVGSVSFCNSAYRTLWNTDPETSFAEYTFKDALLQWRNACEDSPIWSKVHDHMTDLDPREDLFGNLILKDGGTVTLRIFSLSGGFNAIRFEKPVSTVPTKKPAEKLAV